MPNTPNKMKHGTKMIFLFVLIYFSYYNVITSVLPINKEWPSFMTVIPALIGIGVTVILMIIQYVRVMESSNIKKVFQYIILVGIIIVAIAVSDKAMFFSVGIALLFRKWSSRKILVLFLVSHIITVTIIFLIGAMVPGFSLYTISSHVFSGGFFNQNGFAFYMAMILDLATLVFWTGRLRTRFFLVILDLSAAGMLFFILHAYTSVIVILLFLMWLLIFPILSEVLQQLILFGVILFPIFALFFVVLSTLMFGNSPIVALINNVMTLRPEYWNWYHDHFGFHFIGQRIEASKRGLNPPENGVLDGAYFYALLRQGIGYTTIILGLVINMINGLTENLGANWKVIGFVAVLLVSAIPENQPFQVTFSPLIILSIWYLVKVDGQS